MFESNVSLKLVYELESFFFFVILTNFVRNDNELIFSNGFWSQLLFLVKAISQCDEGDGTGIKVL